ncbi:MAG: alpha/beta fold hydrolase [Microlunatus sp.]|nr:alpha/beta fold hydrolase [Microlunatus sp.]
MWSSGRPIPGSASPPGSSSAGTGTTAAGPGGADVRAAADPGLYATVLDRHPDQQHPRIAFCHGLFGQGKNWTTIGRALDEDYTVALVDLPDHGRSPWTDELSYTGMAAQLADYLGGPAAGSGDGGTGSAGGSRWTVVGHSMGGKVAMTLALTRPDLVERLVVVDIAPVDYGGPSDFGAYVEGMRALDLRTLPSREAADDQLAGAVPDPAVRSFLLQNLRRGGAEPGTNWHWQMNLRLLGDQLEVLSGFPDLDGCRYDGPTLWVAGADSGYVKPEYAGTMKTFFPQVRTVKIKNAAHWVHSEQPEIFLQVLRDFLSRTAA